MSGATSGLLESTAQLGFMSVNILTEFVFNYKYELVFRTLGDHHAVTCRDGSRQ
jgi:hypothetical protein